MDIKKIGVLGSNGRLGRELVYAGCTPIPNKIASTQDVHSIIGDAHKAGIEAIINCIAVTSVDEIERASKQSQKKFGVDEKLETIYTKAVYSNSLLPGPLSMSCEKFGVRFIHISTDYIFSGRKGPYEEIPRSKKEETPVNLYGLTKYVGEKAVNVFSSNSIIVRTTGLYGSHKPDFYKLIKQAQEPISVANDLYGNQTHVTHLVDALIALVAMPFPPKIINLASHQIITRYQFAKLICYALGKSPDLLIPTPSKHIPGWIAPRPKNGGLLVNKAIKFGLPIYTIEEGIELAMVQGYGGHYV